MTLGLSMWWPIGWIAFAVVVVIAAVLILLIVGLARKITSEAQEAVDALDATGEKTAVLNPYGAQVPWPQEGGYRNYPDQSGYGVGNTHLAIVQITRGLRRARQGRRR